MKYSNALSILLYIFVFSACSSKIDYASNPHLKAISDEDSLILRAIVHKKLGMNKDSKEIFYDLYQRTGKKEYLKETLYASLNAKDLDGALYLANKHLNDFEDNSFVIRVMVDAYIKKKEYSKALKYALKNLEISKKEIDYQIVSQVYFNIGKFDIALKYLQRAYAINKNDTILRFMSDILYNNLNKKDEAISLLETHSLQFGCSFNVCGKLLEIYSNKNSTNGLLSTYKKLYKTYKLEEYSKAIIGIYIYKKDYKKLITFLEENNVDDVALLEMYIKEESFDKAYKLSYKIYRDTNDYEYLGKATIFKFENLKKRDKKDLKEIVKDLKIVNENISSAVYLNFLGYLLIDYGIDIKEGIFYVEKALDIEPNSGYYLDSLSWGYYKLGECKKANDIMQKVIKIIGTSEAEVRDHIKALKNCGSSSKSAKK